MEKIKSFFGGGGPKAPAFQPMPDRKPEVSAEQRQVPRDFNQIPERVLIHTTLGDITVSLFREQTPRVYLPYPAQTNSMLTCPSDLPQLRHPCSIRILQLRSLPSYHPQLHDPDR